LKNQSQIPPPVGENRPRPPLEPLLEIGQSVSHTAFIRLPRCCVRTGIHFDPILEREAVPCSPPPSKSPPPNYFRLGKLCSRPTESKPIKTGLPPPNNRGGQPGKIWGLSGTTVPNPAPGFFCANAPFFSLPPNVKFGRKARFPAKVPPSKILSGKATVTQKTPISWKPPTAQCPQLILFGWPTFPPKSRGSPTHHFNNRQSGPHSQTIV